MARAFTQKSVQVAVHKMVNTCWKVDCVTQRKKDKRTITNFMKKNLESYRKAQKKLNDLLLANSATTDVHMNFHGKLDQIYNKLNKSIPNVFECAMKQINEDLNLMCSDRKSLISVLKEIRKGHLNIGAYGKIDQDLQLVCENLFEARDGGGRLILNNNKKVEDVYSIIHKNLFTLMNNVVYTFDEYKCQIQTDNGGRIPVQDEIQDDISCQEDGLETFKRDWIHDIKITYNETLQEIFIRLLENSEAKNKIEICDYIKSYIRSLEKN
eukprot:UN33611